MATMPIDTTTDRPAADRLAARRANLRLANQVRIASKDIKRELAKGDMPLSVALEDHRAGVLTVLDVLMAQRWWSRDRALRLLNNLAADNPFDRISETRRVRDLTARQKTLLADRCGKTKNGEHVFAATRLHEDCGWSYSMIGAHFHVTRQTAGNWVRTGRAQAEA